jgi:SSS family solute:Na+ symporter
MPRPYSGTKHFLYTAFPNGKGGYEIPFLICMGLSFLFTIIVMVVISMFGPKVNPKAFELDSAMFKVDKRTLGLIILTLLLLTTLYVRFW